MSSQRKEKTVGKESPDVLKTVAAVLSPVAPELGKPKTEDKPKIKWTPPDKSAAPDTKLVEPPPILVPETVDATLSKILCWKRPHDSNAELEFAKWLRTEIALRAFEPEVMELGCVVLRLPAPDGTHSTTLFSCHIDTVHSVGGKQRIVYDASFGHIFLDKESKDANCLGADDGAGVWLMLEMISARVPGTYVFHRGEERGGLGAHSMREKRKEWLETFECAVAFDRAGTDEVITHQGGMRCCSDKFAEALAKQLNGKPGLAYRLSDRGVFTDTRVYRSLIPECTNLGVGYENQHGTNELLDYAHLVEMRDALLQVKWEVLPIDRNPRVDDRVKWRASAWDGFGVEDGLYYDARFSRHVSNKYQPPNKPEKNAPPPIKESKKPTYTAPTPEVDSVEEVRGMGVSELTIFCENSPEVVATLLVDLASEVAALREKVNFLKGALS